MNLIKICLLLCAAVILTACGGGNGGRGGSSSSSSSSISSSSSSSDEPFANCAEAEGGVFINNVCSPWLDVSAYEQNQLTFESEEVTDGEGNAVIFSIVTTSDTKHHQVVDVQYKEQSSYAAVIRMRSPESDPAGVNMTDFVGGKYVFDLKVISTGVENPQVEFNLDCVWPCASTPIIIQPVELNKWQSVEIPISRLVERGLDLEQITTGFMISPSWGKQSGAHYQIDNIRWEKGSEEMTESICFANHFDSQWIAGVQGPAIAVESLSFDIPDSVLTVGIYPPELRPDWSLMQGVWSYSISEIIDIQTGDLIQPSTLSACSSAGTLSLNIYVPQSYVNDGSLTFTIHVLDDQLNRYELSDTVFSVADMTPNDWNNVSIPLSASTQHDNLRYVGLTFDSTTIDASIEDTLKIDNIIIKQPLIQ